jgi:hypothetical protein
MLSHIGFVNNSQGVICGLSPPVRTPPDAPIARQKRTKSGLLASLSGCVCRRLALALERCFQPDAGTRALLHALALEGGGQPDVPQTHVPLCSIRHSLDSPEPKLGRFRAGLQSEIAGNAVPGHDSGSGFPRSEPWSSDHSCEAGDPVAARWGSAPSMICRSAATWFSRAARRVRVRRGAAPRAGVRGIEDARLASASITRETAPSSGAAINKH